MYYEQNPQKKKKKRATSDPFMQQPRQTPKRKRGCLSSLFKLAFAVAVLIAVFALTSGLLIRNNFFSGSRPDLAVNTKLPDGYTHILLLGADAGESNGGRGRTDSIMIASFGDGGNLKLTSIMRDTMLDMGADGEHKANAAYKLGGGDLALFAVNSAFALNMTKYAVVDFQGIAKVIDAMGGIELTLSKAEMNAINEGLKKAYQKKRVFNGVLMTPLTKYGKNIHMSGTHALVYARTRKIDSDYQRAGRQRVLLSRMIDKLKSSADPITLARVSQAALSCVETNLSPLDMAALGMRALNLQGDLKQYRLPQEGAYKQTTEDGIWMIRPNLKKCRQGLYEFLFS